MKYFVLYTRSVNSTFETDVELNFVKRNTYLIRHNKLDVCLGRRGRMHGGTKCNPPQRVPLRRRRVTFLERLLLSIVFPGLLYT